MNKYTDCFLAVAVIASQINGISTITGISNQRVKECNRIKTVCQNLIKCGIFCHELPDGLIIYGKSVKKNETNHVQKRKIIIQTCNDHRIAMAFTILAAYFEQINHPLKLIIDDKTCVNKSFPEFFLHLQKGYGMKFQGEFVWDEKKEDFESEGVTSQNFLNQNYLILIGMRGVGKSSTAKLLEKKLGWKNYDLDDVVLERFKNEHPIVNSLKEIVEKLGWSAFREVEKKVFREFMQKIIEKELINCVICCGGGVIEDGDNYELLTMMDQVIWIEHSNLKELAGMIAEDKTRPNFSDTFEQVYERRKEKFKQVSKYILCTPGKKNVEEINCFNYYHQIERLKLSQVNQILENNNYKFMLKENTFFLCVSLEKTDQLQKDDFFYIRNNYTALEITITDFIVNELGINNLNNPTEEVLSNLVENIRFKLARANYFLINFEIIITLRTDGRNFEMPNYVYNYILNELKKSSFNFFFDCEYKANNLAFLNNFAAKHQRIILSKHFFEVSTSEDDIMKEFEKMYAFAEYNHKSVKLFKFILSTPCNNSFIEDVRNKASSLPMPNLIFKLGLEGRYSRLEAKIYLPVFDSKIMKPVIEGQLQKCEVQNLRKELYLDTILTKKFYVIGDNVNRSFSPKIHNHVFKNAGLLDHYYDYRNVYKEESLGKILQEKDFVGASITIPYKKIVIKHLDFLVGEAKEIGVVNTVIKSQNKFYGFNTDWYGIYHSFNDKVNELGWTHFKKRENFNKYMLIVGAGATAETAYYCFSKMMNFEVLILNRSNTRFVNFENKGLSKNHMFSTTEEFEKFYNEEVLGKNAEIVGVLNSIPNDNELPMLRKINQKILKSIFNDKCISCDLNYVPKETEFLKLSKELGCLNVIYGIKLLLHQAKLQSEIFSQQEFSYDTLAKNVKI